MTYPATHEAPPLTTCNACGKLVEPPYLRVAFVGKPGSRLTGSTFFTCAGCITLRIPDRGIDLPPRVSNPVAEPESPAWSAA